MPIGNNILAGASGQATGYDIEQSLRLDGYPGTTNQHLERSPSSSGNRKTFTISFWHKPSLFAKAEGDHYIKVKPDANNQFQVSKNASTDTLLIYIEVGGTYKQLYTERVFRDPSQWYHFVIAVDTTQATASNRVKLYVNGVQETAFSTEEYPDQDWETCYNQSGVNQDLLWSREDSGRSPSGYFAEWHSIDGTALDASSFGETNADTNQWVPIEYAGSYGTNGFYLKFQDSAALGDDSSGNTNDFTSSGLASTDQMTGESPTNNFATLNPLDQGWSESSNAGVNSEGNLKTSNTAGGWWAPRASIGQDSGKWYFEVLALASNIYMQCGIEDPENNAQTSGNSYRYRSNGNKYAGSGAASYGATWSSSGDIIGVAMNLDDNEVTFYKNNSSQGAISIASGVIYQPVAVVADSGIVCANFGQDSSFAGNKTAQGNTDGNGKGDFYYTPPGSGSSAYLALCSDNLSDPSIADPTKHFNTVLFDGSASSKSVTGVGFSPDYVWLKSRSTNYNHRNWDTVRGADKRLSSDGTGAEVTSSDLTSFDSDGITLAGGTGANNSGQTFVTWNWKAGGTASSNTDGTITSSVSANTDAGFSIVGWAGTGSNVTVGHGLSQAPELIINKSRTLNTSSSQWAVQSILWNSTSDTNILYLNGTGAASDDTNVFQAAPTATVFSPQGGGWAGIGASGEDYIAYCFHSVDGYSKVFEWDGNGSSDGVFQYLGFTPAFCLLKCYSGSSTQEWVMFDNKRNTYNVVDNFLYADQSAAESSSGTRIVDFVSNGLKFRGNDGATNTSGRSYIGYAVASSPFKTSNAR